MRSFLLIVSVAAVGLSACLLSSCLEGFDTAIFTCPHPDLGHLNFLGQLDPCCGDASNGCPQAGPPPPQASPAECDGSCLPVAPSGHWVQTPVLLWHGPGFSDMPVCPPEATAAFPLGRDPTSPGSCFSCECSDPSCVLPEGLIADGAAGCEQGPFTPFPAEADGSCSDKASIDPNQLQSIAILPPTVSKCVGTRVSAPVPRQINIREWNTVALVCNGAGAGGCPEPDKQYCFPSASSNFARCVEGRTVGHEDTPCPPGYPHHHVYYENHDTSVECTPCACSPPIGSVCTAAVTAYTNDACTDDGAIFKDFIVSQGPPACVNVQPNTGLKGLTEAWIQNQPGKCDPSTSVHTGKVAPLHASAHEYCCADPDFPDPDF
jgi:hypothetical protein